jgi:hypothetical protein
VRLEMLQQRKSRRVETSPRGEFWQVYFQKIEAVPSLFKLLRGEGGFSCSTLRSYGCRRSSREMGDGPSVSKVMTAVSRDALNGRFSTSIKSIAITNLPGTLGGRYGVFGTQSSTIRTAWLRYGRRELPFWLLSTPESSQNAIPNKSRLSFARQQHERRPKGQSPPCWHHWWLQQTWDLHRSLCSNQLKCPEHFDVPALWHDYRSVWSSWNNV